VWGAMYDGICKVLICAGCADGRGCVLEDMGWDGRIREDWTYVQCE
jgi:hypothetical protein